MSRTAAVVLERPNRPNRVMTFTNPYVAARKAVTYAENWSSYSDLADEMDRQEEPVELTDKRTGFRMTFGYRDEMDV